MTTTKITPSEPTGTKPTEYEEASELDWAGYEFATIEYDYKIHPEAAKRIQQLFVRLYNA